MLCRYGSTSRVRVSVPHAALLFGQDSDLARVLDGRNRRTAFGPHLVRVDRIRADGDAFSAELLQLVIPAYDAGDLSCTDIREVPGVEAYENSIAPVVRELHGRDFPVYIGPPLELRCWLVYCYHFLAPFLCCRSYTRFCSPYRTFCTTPASTFLSDMFRLGMPQHCRSPRPPR